MEWKPHGESLLKLKAKLHSRYIKLTVIICYVPQNEKSDQEKDAFYDNLFQAIQTAPLCDMQLVLRDMNAKLGKKSSSKTNILGHNGNINTNGRRQGELCEENNLIGGTLFHYKNSL